LEKLLVIETNPITCSVPWKNLRDGNPSAIDRELIKGFTNSHGISGLDGGALEFGRESRTAERMTPSTSLLDCLPVNSDVQRMACGVDF
jgi:hypothetical protein